VQARFIREMFLEADVDGSGSLDLQEALQLSARLGLGRSKEFISKAVSACADPTSGELTLIGFEALMMALGKIDRGRGGVLCYVLCVCVIHL
jgi:Ca2+-binding EF-hand superfamily protein